MDAKCTLFSVISSFMNSVFFSGGPLSALTCCVNVRLLSAIKKNIVALLSKQDAL